MWFVQYNVTNLLFCSPFIFFFPLTVMLSYVVVVQSLNHEQLFKKIIIYFLLKDNSFTEFCCFLSNLNTNQPSVYICPLSFETLWTADFKLLCSWNSPSKNARVSCHFLLQGIFLNQGSNHIFYISGLPGKFFIPEPPGKPETPMCCCCCCVDHTLKNEAVSCVSKNSFLFLYATLYGFHCFLVGCRFLKVFFCC